MLRFILTHCLLGIAIFWMALAPAHAFKDDKQQIARQWQAHDQAIKSAMRAFANGDNKAQLAAATTIATSEAYLAILGVPADDSRLVAWLFDDDQHISEQMSHLFHYLLKEKTGFEPRLGTLLMGSSAYNF